MTRLLASSLTFSITALWLSGCADELAPQDDGIELGDTAKVSTARDADGTYVTTVDATATDAWTALDFDRGVEAQDGDAQWDLAARRVGLRLPVPAGAGGVAVMALGDVALGEVTAAATGEWLADRAGDPALARGDGWYAYDPTTHVVSPRPITWLLRTTEGGLRALRIESYYDEAGTAARLRLRWRPVRAANAEVAP